VNSLFFISADAGATANPRAMAPAIANAATDLIVL
jgi:hypothetical protein